MGPAIWFELVNPADLLPARYHRLPEAPPYPTTRMNSPHKADSKRSIQAVAREVHTLHFRVWDNFVWKLRQLLQPHPSLTTTVHNLIHEANATFLQPLQDIGWKPKPA